MKKISNPVIKKLNLKLENMKTSEFFWNKKNQKCEIWSESVGNTTDYWLRIDGVSETISQRRYKILKGKVDKLARMYK